jgi:coproporphyrinogen III oxidase
MKGFKTEFVAIILALQNKICKAMEDIDTLAIFSTDMWERNEGGGGISRIMEGGEVFEKAGVNVSQVFGTLPQSMMDYLEIKHSQFFATGLSLVIHPLNPFVPTVHANYRYFEVYDSDNVMTQFWFGGGSDLTPYYLFEEDAIHFHQTLKDACDQFDKGFYPDSKKMCDTYFYNSHRKEGRGVGGIFFDRITANDPNEALSRFNLQVALANSFLNSYLPIVGKRKDIAYTSDNKNWQEIRRGRYVEFNLLHDKGTLFGLKTNGRVESIFMSLPPTVQWHYNTTPQINSEEEKLLSVLTNPREWLNV